MTFQSIFKRHEQEIFDYAQKFLNSKTGQELIENYVKREIKIYLSDTSIDNLLNCKNTDKFYEVLEKTIMKRFNIK